MSIGADRRVAIVGSGVAGLTAAWVASRTAHVTLFEADDRLGGHADTHLVATPDGDLAVDTGFIVHNRRTYPTLLRLFAELGIKTQPSEMSLSVSDAETGVQYAGALGPRGLFATRASLASPTHWRMLTEIPRFHRRARALLAGRGGSGRSGWNSGQHATTSSLDTPAADQTLREFLDAGGFSAHFVRHFMEPLVAAVWSCDPATALDYPARYLFTFLEHHGMLGVFGSPEWRTVTGGSVTYVTAVAAGLQEIRLDTKVTSVREVGGGVEITDGSGAMSSYDAVVIATHPAQALAILEAPTPLQRELLAAMPYSANVALLHTDASLLPDAAAARASWNFHRPRTDNGQVTVTYDLTRLQRLPTDIHYLVTLGGEDLVDPATVIDRMEYDHPLYTPASVSAGRRLPEINTDRIAFAGAYHGWGFHEDGARSGLAAATHLGLPWTRPERVVVEPGRFETTIRHTRRTPFHRTFEHSSTFWLVDLDDLPDHGRLASFEARDHLGSPDRTIRANVEALLATHDVSLGTGGAPGRILMAAHPRSLGHSFNPISVFWCFDDAGDQAAVVVEVHNTYGDRHAYVVHPDEQGRARTDKAMYVSPFHGIDGYYDVAVPLPTDRLHVAVTLRGHDDGGSAPFSASLTGTRSDLPVRRTLGAAIRGSVLIRAHGIFLWARRLPIRPRTHPHRVLGLPRCAPPSDNSPGTPTDPSSGGGPMTLEKNARPAVDSLPALEPLVRSPRTAMSSAVARRLFRAAVSRLAVTVVEEPTGRTLGQGGPTMRMHRPDEFYARLGRDGLIGFGESYLTGAWDADDLAGFLTVPAARIATLVPDSLQRLRALVVHRTPGHHRSTEANSRANVSHHYDLSNELFALFLDETLSYSSALFEGSLAEADFAEAQGRKIERLLDAAGVTHGSRVLEIGTGWGELAIRAARRGATVHTITLSVEQLELAGERIAAAGVADRVRVELMDYRALGTDGSTYDAVLSVEMIEAVGHEFWPTYFEIIDKVLAPGGRVAIQAITMPHDRMLATRGTHTWINKYVFPGGFLPSVEVIDQVTRDHTRLRLVDQLDMGSHYAETLRRWDRRFLARRDDVLALGFDDAFMRMWHFYLAYSQAGFASGYIDVQQLAFSREDR